jgi:hypothetical protein
MEKLLTNRLLVRIPENKNLTNTSLDIEPGSFTGKRFTAADMWGLRRSFVYRKPRTNNLFNY